MEERSIIFKIIILYLRTSTLNTVFVYMMRTCHQMLLRGIACVCLQIFIVLLQSYFAMQWMINTFLKPEVTKILMFCSWPPGVVPESQCQVKREQKKARDKDKKDYPSVGSPIAEDKAAPISPVSKDVSKNGVFILQLLSCISHYILFSFVYSCFFLPSFSFPSFLSNHLLPSHEYWVGWFMSVPTIFSV